MAGLPPVSGRARRRPASRKWAKTGRQPLLQEHANVADRLCALADADSACFSVRNISMGMAVLLKYFDCKASRFTQWCEDHGIRELTEVRPFHVAAFVKDLQERLARPTVKV